MGILDNFKNPWAPNYNSNSALGNNVLNNNTNDSDPYNVLNTLALQTDVLNGRDEVLGVRNENSKKKSVELRAEFIFCFTERVIFEERLNENSMRLIAKGMANAINAFFSSGIETAPNTFLRNTKFKHYFSRDAPEDLAFDVYEDFSNTAQYQSAIDLGLRFQTYDSELKKQNFEETNIKNRGLKIIIVEHSGLQNSRAEKNGMLAFLNFEHIRGFALPNSQPKSYELQNITLCHEVGHLFGLSDRYQFLVWYNAIDNNCFSIVGKNGQSRELIPIPIDASRDERANDDTMAYMNLMYGVHDYANLLTEYQLKIIWGVAGNSKNIDVEDDYIQTIFILPVQLEVYTGDRFWIEKDANQKGFLASILNGNVYSQISGSNGTQNFTGNVFFITNGAIGNNINNIIGAIPKLRGSNTINVQGANTLGTIIWNLPNCQPRPGSGVSAIANQLALNLFGN